MFFLAVLFQLITLPVEFNASHRAMQELEHSGILGGAELKDTRKVLTAAAMTYVASAASMILQLLRLIILFGGPQKWNCIHCLTDLMSCLSDYSGR